MTALFATLAQPDSLIRITQAARFLDVDPRTLRKRCAECGVEVLRLGPKVSAVRVKDLHDVVLGTSKED